MCVCILGHSVVSDSATLWTAVHQASLSFIISWSLLKLMSIKSVTPSNHLILCQPLLLLPSIYLSIRVFSNESILRIGWPQYWRFSFSISPFNSGLISFLTDWFWSPCCPRDSQESSLTPQFKSINYLEFNLLYGPILTSIHPPAAAKSLQSYPTLWDPIDGSPPGSPVPGILQARTLEWVAISFSNAWKWKVKVQSLSPVWLLATPWTAAYLAPPSMGFSRQEHWSRVPSPSPIHTWLLEKP